MAKATTVRFADEVFARLDQASARTGMPVNSIVVAACLEWMDRHTPGQPGADVAVVTGVSTMPTPPRWATLRRAVEVAVGKRAATGAYPFERFTASAQQLLTAAQTEAVTAGYSYIGTEHMLLAAFADPDFHSTKILASIGVEEAAVRSMLDKVIGRGPSIGQSRIIPTSRVKIVIELAFKICGTAGDPRVSTGHVLLALAAEGQGIAAHVLKDLGATRDRIQQSLTQLTEPEP